MAPWIHDPRFPPVSSHFLYFYFLLNIPTVVFALWALVVQVQRYKSVYRGDKCYAFEIVTYAIAFPTSILALAHSITLLYLAKTRQLSVKILLFSCLGMSIAWIPTLVVGWQPYYSYYINAQSATTLDSDYLPYTRTCYTVTGALLSANNQYYYLTWNLTTRLQVLMGVIIMTFGSL